MKIGDVTITPRQDVDPWWAATLVRAIQETEHPAASDLYIAAIFLFFDGPKGWPQPEKVASFRAWGHERLAYLVGHGADLATALSLGRMCAEELVNAGTPKAEKVEEYRSFFDSLRPSSDEPA